DSHHPASCRLPGGDHLEFCPPYHRKPPRWMLRIGCQGVPSDFPLRDHQRRSELSLIELLQAVATPDLLEAFGKAMDLDAHGSRRKLRRPVFWFQEQVVSPRNDHTLGELALVGAHGPDEFELSHWLALP